IIPIFYFFSVFQFIQQINIFVFILLVECKTIHKIVLDFKNLSLFVFQTKRSVFFNLQYLMMSKYFSFQENDNENANRNDITTNYRKCHQYLFASFVTIHFGNTVEKKDIKIENCIIKNCSKNLIIYIKRAMFENKHMNNTFLFNKFYSSFVLDKIIFWNKKEVYSRHIFKFYVFKVN
ncbi:hypothetical protein RFI_34129, partial [Reticulomyxa filosa]